MSTHPAIEMVNRAPRVYLYDIRSSLHAPGGVDPSAVLRLGSVVFGNRIQRRLTYLTCARLAAAKLRNPTYGNGEINFGSAVALISGHGPGQERYIRKLCSAPTLALAGVISPVLSRLTQTGAPLDWNSLAWDLYRAGQSPADTRTIQIRWAEQFARHNEK